MIDKLAQLLVWLILLIIVALEAWFLLDPTRQSDARVGEIKFLALVWFGTFLAIAVMAVFKRRKYPAPAMHPPMTRILRRSAFVASIFSIFAYLYVLVRSGPA